MFLPTFAGQGDIAPLLNRIHHCDALELVRRLPDQSADMILVDPPYNVTQAHYEYELDLAAYGKEFFRVIKPSGAVVVTAAQPFTSELIVAWKKQFRYEWIWRKTRKTNFLNAKKMPLAAHESVLVFGNKLPDYYPQMKVGERHEKKTRNSGGLYGDIEARENTYDNLFYPDSVLEFPHDGNLTKTNKQGREPNHPNQKSLALWQYLVNTYTTEGAIVLDCFVGGGTTAVAASGLNRQFICCDNHKPYVEMARNRLAKSKGLDYVRKDNSKQLGLFQEQSA